MSDRGKQAEMSEIPAKFIPTPEELRESVEEERLTEIYQDKTVLIIGGTLGNVGGVQAALLAAAGAKVILADYDEQGAMDLKVWAGENMGLNVDARKVDVTKQDDLKNLLNGLGELDYVFNYAAIFTIGNDIPEEALDRAWKVGVQGSENVINAVLSLNQKKLPRVFMASSIAAYIQGLEAVGLYPEEKLKVIEMVMENFDKFADRGGLLSAMILGFFESKSFTVTKPYNTEVSIEEITEAFAKFNPMPILAAAKSISKVAGHAKKDKVYVPGWVGPAAAVLSVLPEAIKSIFLNKLLSNVFKES